MKIDYLARQKEIESLLERNCVFINVLINKEENEKTLELLDQLYNESELLYRCLHALEYDKKKGTLIHNYIFNEYNEMKNKNMFKSLNEANIKKLS